MVDGDYYRKNAIEAVGLTNFLVDKFTCNHILPRQIYHGCLTVGNAFYRGMCNRTCLGVLTTS